MLLYILELLGVEILSWLPPQEAHNLSYCSKFSRECVLSFYHTYSRQLISKGGAWHHRLCKRTRDSVSRTHNISYMPLAIQSFLNQSCGFCGKRYRAALHPVFGVLAHQDCIRHYLINTYYLKADFGLTFQDVEGHIPHQTLTGYSLGYYEYHVIAKDAKHGLWPYEWTCRYLTQVVHREKVDEFLSHKLTQVARHHTKLQNITHKRHEALKERLRCLKKHFSEEEIKRFQTSGIGSHFCPRYFGEFDIICPTPVSVVVGLVYAALSLLENGKSADEIKTNLKMIRENETFPEDVPVLLSNPRYWRSSSLRRRHAHASASSSEH